MLDIIKRVVILQYCNFVISSCFASSQVFPLFLPPPQSLSISLVTDPTVCPQMLEDILLGEEGSMPLVALASFPRSGNTWTRLLLQVASQYSTGSVYWETEQRFDFNKKSNNLTFNFNFPFK